jgi:hypothetical protein
MELTANVWPVADAQTGLVQRYYMRAYALEAEDAVISATLRSLAPSDWLMAEQFLIPKNFQEVSCHGVLEGCVGLRQFHEHQGRILEAAFRTLEDGYARLQGVTGEGGGTAGPLIIPRFPENPYLIVTTLLETPDGRLLPQVRPVEG